MIERDLKKMQKRKSKKILNNIKRMTSLELVGLSVLILLIPGGSIVALYKLLQENGNDDKS